MTWSGRLGFGLLAACLLVALGWGLAAMFRPAPVRDLETTVPHLITTGRADEAEVLLERRLRVEPRDAWAALMLGQILTDRIERRSAELEVADAPTRALARRVIEATDPFTRPLLEARSASASVANPEIAAGILLFRSKALYALGRLPEMEACLQTALEIQPTVPEAGWALLELYYLQSRALEAHDLALRLHEIEPDPHDRVQLLLELVRQDAQPPDASSQVDLFEPIVAEHPEDVRSAVSYGLALVRSSRFEEGLDVLLETVQRHSRDPIAWNGWLDGLQRTGRMDALDAAIEQLPEAIQDDLRFEVHRGRVAQEQGDWERAADHYRAAFEANPIDPTILHRLGQALRNSGRAEEAAPLLEAVATYKQAVTECRDLYREANALPDLGLVPRPDLNRRLADLRLRMLRPAEARAWLRLAADARPDDPEIRAALDRLDALLETPPLERVRRLAPAA